MTGHVPYCSAVGRSRDDVHEWTAKVAGVKLSEAFPRKMTNWSLK